ncbi:oocyte zinc finger protein XlCOF6-like [Schistocerca americana]|uniref:oocyte zinc finger protein XlCOF6-like n=1 Tax=Schistocerca americana TaxID=7009 RepID=UPI001F500B46|nr:oocyte zinc finger protein XlCOF6-like [Schistocerca americana]
MAADSLIGKTFINLELFLHKVAQLGVFEALIFNYKLKVGVLEPASNLFKPIVNELINELQLVIQEQALVGPYSQPAVTSPQNLNGVRIETCSSNEEGKTDTTRTNESVVLSFCEIDYSTKDIQNLTSLHNVNEADSTNHETPSNFQDGDGNGNEGVVTENIDSPKENVKACKTLRRKQKDERCCKTENDVMGKSSHMQDTGNNDSRSRFFMCPVCNRKFLKESRLAAHLSKCGKAKGKAETRFCEYCDMGFSSQRVLNLHIERIHKLPLASTESASTAGDTISLKDDFPDDLPFFCCVVCQSAYKSVSDFVTHACKDASLKLGREAVASAEHLRQLRKFLCGLCREEFRSLARTLYHLARCSGGPYRCELCPNKYDYPRELNQHKSKAHRGANSFFCDECGLNFKLRTSLQKHKVNRHERHESLFTCDECSKTFTKRIHLTRHKICFHRFERKFLCQVCGKKFSTHSSLSAHLDTHTELKRFSCTFCSRKFRQKEKLKFHIRIHTGERPHLCQTCGKGFIRKSKLDDHIRRHLGEKRYSCDLCPKCYASSWDLKLHRKKCHPEVESSNPPIEASASTEAPSELTPVADIDDPDEPSPLPVPLSVETVVPQQQSASSTPPVLVQLDGGHAGMLTLTDAVQLGPLMAADGTTATGGPTLGTTAQFVQPPPTEAFGLQPGLVFVPATFDVSSITY